MSIFLQCPKSGSIHITVERNLRNSNKQKNESGNGKNQKLKLKVNAHELESNDLASRSQIGTAQLNRFQ